MKIAIGISTLNDGIYQVQEKIRSLPENIIVIISHQISDDKNYPENTITYPNAIIKKSFVKGLSKSRNVLLEQAIILNIDYLLISDDDVFYLNEGLLQLEDFLNKQSGNSHYQFQSCTEDGMLRKKYPHSLKEINRLDSFKISSIEMCLNIKNIIRNGARFDERFGLGATYQAGEEPIFINDLLKSKERIFFVPITVTVHPIESSGNKIFTSSESLADRGAIFIRCGGYTLGLIYLFAFWMRKFLFSKVLIENKIKPFSALLILLKGYFSV
ncbi:hypothetical protein ACEV6Q_19110 [Enterobacter ludwigii]|uniref:hypothetical protein n=1 Tax=Enterobacter ludwigii TaxID=299767 RepID=UPI003BEEC854